MIRRGGEMFFGSGFFVLLYRVQRPSLPFPKKRIPWRNTSSHFQAQRWSYPMANGRRLVATHTR